MTVTFGGEMIQCSTLERKVGNVRPNDLMLYEGELMRVETVQSDCIDFHNHRFIMIILFSATGRMVALRGELPESVMVWRPRKTVRKANAA